MTEVEVPVIPMPNAVPPLVVAVSVDGGALGVTVVEAGPGARVRIRVETSIVPSVTVVSSWAAAGVVGRLVAASAKAPARRMRATTSIDVLLRSRARELCARTGWIKPDAKGT